MKRKNKVSNVGLGRVDSSSGKTVFNGLMTYISLQKHLKDRGITSYAVKQGITEVEIKGNVIIVPPHLERIISSVLQDTFE